MLPDDVKARVDAGAEHIKIKMRYGGVGILRKDFCDNTAQFEIDFGQPINVQCPVRIIHAIGVSSTNHLAKGFLHLCSNTYILVGSHVQTMRKDFNTTGGTYRQ